MKSEKREKSFKILEDAALPTNKKEKILGIFNQYRKYETSSVGKLYKLIAVYRGALPLPFPLYKRWYAPVGEQDIQMRYSVYWRFIK